MNIFKIILALILGIVICSTAFGRKPHITRTRNADGSWNYYRNGQLVVSTNKTINDGLKRSRQQRSFATKSNVKRATEYYKLKQTGRPSPDYMKSTTYQERMAASTARMKKSWASKTKYTYMFGRIIPDK